MSKNKRLHIDTSYKVTIGLAVASTILSVTVYASSSQDMYAGFIWAYLVAFYAILALAAVSYNAILLAKNPAPNKPSTLRSIVRIIVKSIVLLVFALSLYLTVYWYLKPAAFGFAVFGILFALVFPVSLVTVMGRSKKSSTTAMIGSLLLLLLVWFLYPHVVNAS